MNSLDTYFVILAPLCMNFTAQRELSSKHLASTTNPKAPAAVKDPIGPSCCTSLSRKDQEASFALSPYFKVLALVAVLYSMGRYFVLLSWPTLWNGLYLLKILHCQAHGSFSKISAAMSDRLAGADRVAKRQPVLVRVQLARSSWYRRLCSLQCTTHQMTELSHKLRLTLVQLLQKLVLSVALQRMRDVLRHFSTANRPAILKLLKESNVSKCPPSQRRIGLRCTRTFWPDCTRAFCLGSSVTLPYLLYCKQNHYSWVAARCISLSTDNAFSSRDWPSRTGAEYLQWRQPMRVDASPL